MGCFPPLPANESGDAFDECLRLFPMREVSRVRDLFHAGAGNGGAPALAIGRRDDAVLLAPYQSVGRSMRCSQRFSRGLCMYGFQPNRANASRPRTIPASSVSGSAV